MLRAARQIKDDSLRDAGKRVEEDRPGDAADGIRLIHWTRVPGFNSPE